MDESTMRVFLAVSLNDHIKHSINSQVDLIKKDCNFQVRWVKESQLHLTLCFLGNITPNELDSLCSAMQELGDVPPFPLELQEIIAFPVHKPRIIAISIHLSNSLATLVELIEKRSMEVGIELEARDFLPHITLGRIAKPRRKILPLTQTHISCKQQVNHIALFKSQLTPNGSLYTVLKEFKLKSTES